MSELDKVIPPEIYLDELYQLIIELCQKPDIHHVLEIGSSAGTGSTRAFYEGIIKTADRRTNLYCLEISKPRFEALQEYYKSQPWVHCFNLSAVDNHEMPSPEYVREFYTNVPSCLNEYPLEQVLGWLEQDLDYIKRENIPGNGIEVIKNKFNIENFDVVLIDGSEFTGEAELRHVYGARYLILDDVRGLKNHRNYEALCKDPQYTLYKENLEVRNGYAIFEKCQPSLSEEKPIKSEPRCQSSTTFIMEAPDIEDLTDQFIKSLEDSKQLNTRVSEETSLPIHLFTIVLNGMPFLKHHIEALKNLNLDWHWHIVEGLADLRHSTGWGLPNGATLPEEFHSGGRSLDGTSEYIDELNRLHPENITVYRKPVGSFWDGKLEMVRAPLENIEEPCLLWQLDSDELWTTEQFVRMHDLFDKNPDKHAAYVNCNYFVGPKKYISTLNAWATQPLDWLRVWRFEPGMQWAAHEPPTLVNREGENLVDLGFISRDETMSAGLVYEHPSYVLPSQVEFKESYYGYRDALKCWHQLQNCKEPANPANYLHWAADNGALAEDWNTEQKGDPLFFKYLSKQTSKNVILACDLAKLQQGADLTRVSTESDFKRAIDEVFRKVKPTKIIETGTYLGTGTTAIIASAIRELGLNNAKFFSIEVNPSHFQQAFQNLQNQGLLPQVDLVYGLSVPRTFLPSLEEIEQFTVNDLEFDNLIVDHQEFERARLYYNETNFEAPEDALGKCLRYFDNEPDFILLDSAGYMGHIEFNYVINQLRKPCIIALDDIYHIKHHRSYLQMRSDPRFDIYQASTEKFGFCVGRFTPYESQVAHLNPDSTKRNIIWLRNDSIGDAILANSMLPFIKGKYPNSKLIVACQNHLRELYLDCPFVDHVVGFSNQRLEQDEEYREDIISRLNFFNADLLLHSVYSRTVLAEFLAIQIRAREKVAISGDTSNLDSALKQRADSNYSKLIASTSSQVSELVRHKDFLKGLDINMHQLRPLLWTSIDDEKFAEELLRQPLQSKTPIIAIFGGAQESFRTSDKLGKALKTAGISTNSLVIALGTGNEHALNERNCIESGLPYINLSGKTTLAQSAAIIKRCKFVLGTETSLAHMAATCNVPNIVILGGGHFGRFFPYSESTKVVNLPMDCYNCNWKCKYGNFPCLSMIDADMIARVIKMHFSNLIDTNQVETNPQASATSPLDLFS